MLSFDGAVKVGLEFLEKSDKTLIVVTADHETGGLCIVGGAVHGKDIEIDWYGKKHTGQMVPIFAQGCQAHLFTGVKDNTDIAKIFAKLLGLHNFPGTVPSS